MIVMEWTENQFSGEGLTADLEVSIKILCLNNMIEVQLFIQHSFYKME
jgi:hypothetical protein